MFDYAYGFAFGLFQPFRLRWSVKFYHLLAYCHWSSSSHRNSLTLAKVRWIRALKRLYFLPFPETIWTVPQSLLRVFSKVILFYWIRCISKNNTKYSFSYYRLQDVVIIMTQIQVQVQNNCNNYSWLQFWKGGNEFTFVSTSEKRKYKEFAKITRQLFKIAFMFAKNEEETPSLWLKGFKALFDGLKCSSRLLKWLTNLATPPSMRDIV